MTSPPGDLGPSGPPGRGECGTGEFVIPVSCFKDVQKRGCFDVFANVNLDFFLIFFFFFSCEEE